MTTLQPESFNQENNHSLSTTATITIGGDITVKRLGFGTMQIPGPGSWGEPVDPENARAVLRRVVELGINFIDTSDYYGPAVANRLIAEALYPYPRDLVFATKVGFTRGADKSFQPDPHPQHITQACEENLRRLRLETLDIVHFRYGGDTTIPFADSVGALKQLQDQGKIRHIGLSNVTLDLIEEAQSIVQLATVENLYNLADRSSDPIVDWCTQHGVVFLPFVPLGKGNLVQPNGPLARLAPRYQSTPAQLALAWLLARSPMILPIPGTVSLKHLEENWKAIHLSLSAEDVQTIAAALDAAPQD